MSNLRNEEMLMSHVLVANRSLHPKLIFKKCLSHVSLYILSSFLFIFVYLIACFYLVEPMLPLSLKLKKGLVAVLILGV